MNILVSRTLYMSCQAGPGIEPGPSALKASALPIELTWQTYITNRLCHVVGPGFVSISPDFMRSPSHPVDPHGRLAKNGNSSPHCWGRGFRHNLYSSLYAVSFEAFSICITDQHKQTASHAERNINDCHRMHTRHNHTAYA